jgi:predicted alpha/beta hydrolase family esterase
MPRIILAHGYNAHPDRNWFPWLREVYGDDVVTIPKLPNPTAPQLSEWVSVLSDALGDGGDDTILIGHSLGTVTSAKTLEQLDTPWNLRGLILVAGFCEPLPGWPALDAFVAEPIDPVPVISNVHHRVVFVSDDDAAVPRDLTERFASLLEAELFVVPGAGHFSDSTGMTSFPEILPVVDRMLSER